ncbi:MAG: DUF1365 domain-containing protein [Rhodospirillaceae bacterium]
MSFRSALYAGEVVHKRVQPKTHRLRYGVFSILFDIDELPRLGRDLPLFGYNRRAAVSFHDRDHGPRDGGALRPWAEAQMRSVGIEPDGGAIELLCYPRLFGYVFNPLSVYFCRRKDGALAAILYEVHNTHGEQHTYAMPVGGGAGQPPVIKQRADKAFFVSPFIGPSATYNFVIVPPGEGVSIVIREEAAGALLMAASFRGLRRPLTGPVLLRHLIAFPLMTFKVIAAIHWEALKMAAKGFQIFRHTPHHASHHAPGQSGTLS